MAERKRTPLFPLYAKYGAKTVEFAGWELPVQFSGILAEHHAVRTNAGLFDVSHMGELEVTGADATAFLQKMLTNDVGKMQVHQAMYSPMCYPDGGTVDDLLVYKLSDDRYLAVVNAANTDKDFAWLRQHAEGDVKIANVSEQTAQLALQGPRAEKVLQKLTETDLSAIGPFRFLPDVNIAGKKALVSRTGYTGEDGFEIYVSPENAPLLWEEILAAGAAEGVLPCGLGARDTLRFEAGLPLYGQELTAGITPIEAGLGFAVKIEKTVDFIGKDVLRRQKKVGPPRRLVGVEMIDRGIPRSQCPVYIGEVRIGEITSGTHAPTLKKNVGLALVKAEYASVGTELEVEVRNRRLRAVVVKTPFYKRGKK
ncbi:glycine cleavage system aminomethyltransferase GcvT [Bacillaceae bacterium]